MNKINLKRVVFVALQFCITVFFATLLSAIILYYSFTPTYLQDNNLVNIGIGENQTIFDIISKVAINVSEAHEYVLNKYDCSEFSKDLVAELKKKNISSYCVLGLLKKDNHYVVHNWVEVIINQQTYPIEATGGFIIDNQRYVQDFVKLKDGYCS